MAISPSDEIEFSWDEPDPVVAVMAEMIEVNRGWINLVPEVQPGHDPPPRSTVAAIFSARGEPVPHATWAAPEAPGGRATLGIEHGTGPKALPRLDEHGLGLRPGWLKAADHPRRGLVVTSPPAEDPRAALDWLLEAAHGLCVVPLTGAWSARIYRG